MLVSSLNTILFCKAVGGTVCGVFNDNVSKRKGWGSGGDKNKFSAAPSRSACEPENASMSSSPNKSSSSLDVSVTFCFLTYLHLFLILRSCSPVNVLQILHGFSCVTQGSSLYLLLCKLGSSYVSRKEDKSDNTLMTWAY